MKTNKIRAAIALAGLTQKSTAELAGITQSAFSRKLSGDRSFLSPEINKLQEILQLTDEQVMDLFIH